MMIRAPRGWRLTHDILAQGRYKVCASTDRIDSPERWLLVNSKAKNCLSVADELREWGDGRVAAVRQKAAGGEEQLSAADAEKASVEELIAILAKPEQWAGDDKTGIAVCTRLMELGQDSFARGDGGGGMPDAMEQMMEQMMSPAARRLMMQDPKLKELIQQKGLSMRPNGDPRLTDGQAGAVGCIMPLLEVNEDTLAAARGVVDGALLTRADIQGEPTEPSHEKTLLHTMCMKLLAELTAGCGGVCGIGGGGLQGARWMETEAGSEYQTMLCEAGALKAAVLVCDGPGATSACGVIRSILFGHDGREGHNDPVAAAARREHAASLGAIETLVDLIKRASTEPGAPGLSSCAYTVETFPEDCKDLREMDLRGMFFALQRLCLGFESNGAGAARRARAAALGAIPAIVDAIASEFSEDLFKKGLSTALTIAGAGKGVAPHEEDRALKAQWDQAVAKHPDLQRKLTEMMAAKMGRMAPFG